MAHQLFVDIELDDVEVKSKDVVFKVYRAGEKFGELRVSQGAIVWRGRRDKQGRKLSWRRFDRLMEETASRAETRKPGTRLGVPRRKRMLDG
jgi:hypothetical protein